MYNYLSLVFLVSLDEQTIFKIPKSVSPFPEINIGKLMKTTAKCTEYFYNEKYKDPRSE